MSTDPVLPEGTDLIALDEVDSTMSEAARRAPPARPTWIMAKHQSSARGRSGKPWQHPTGNFAATWLTVPDLPMAEVALTSFAAALALADALAGYVARERLSLKWPNDVLLDGRKIAGILLETSGRAGKADWLAVGIGVNLIAAPSPADLPAGAVPPIALNEAGPTVTPTRFLTDLARSMDHWTRTLTTDGFATLRHAWLQDAARIGERITARTQRDTWTGIFDSIDETGQLILQTDKGPVRIAAADIFF